MVNRESALCVRCLHALPVTNFHLYAGNPVEQQLSGRISPVSAMAYCYFTRGAMMQELLHRVKYKGHTQLGRLLGRMMGKALQESKRFEGIEALVPLPLHRAKERARGYNQAVVLCEGLAEVLQLPVIKTAVVRLSSTETQTHKNRIERWQNMQGIFKLAQPQLIAGKHLLLVDDVITTGATIDACMRAMMETEEIRLSVAALAWSYS